MAFSRADALAAVAQSPSAAGARDRAAWVGLFTADGRVEDPVGSRPHRGRAEIGRFFDTFIAPRDVVYLPDVDIVSGSVVLRDGVLQAALGSVDLRVPIYIRYDLQVDDGTEPKITALSAFWELPAMVRQFLGSGLKGVPAGLALSKALVTNQGVIGTVGFLRALQGPGTRGKRRFRAFLDDAIAGDEVAVRRWLGRDARITVGDDVALPTADLLSHLAGSRPRKLIAAGNTVTTGLDRGGARTVLIAEVAAKPFAIKRIRVFAEQFERTGNG